jgi:hypothetical protein
LGISTTRPNPVIKITAEEYQGVVEHRGIVAIADSGRKYFVNLTPLVDRMFPSWSEQVVADHRLCRIRAY